MKIIDISQPLHNQTPGWPGDTPFQYQVSWSKEQSGSVNVGMIKTSTHIGTHIDAPFHFDNEGKRVIDLDLELYIGDALVVDLDGLDSIGAEDFKGIDLSGVRRLLIRTGCWKERSQFPESITFLRPNLAPFLAQQGVGLIGVDVPSVDQLDSKELEAHHSLKENGIHILEGIVLEDVKPGKYELVALPLPLVEGDGSPVRAILREI